MQKVAAFFAFALFICPGTERPAAAQRAPLVRSPVADSVRLPDRTRHTHSSHWYSFLISNDPNWCTGNLAANAFRFCRFFSEPDSAHKAAKYYWDTSDPGLGLAENLNAIGNSRTESTYLELLSDYWNTVRVSFGGVYTAQPSDSTSSAADKSQSKAAQFLNGGGPALVTLVRPLAVASLIGARTQLLGSVHSAFSVPASGESAPDSMKFAEADLELQTVIGGSDNKIGGDASLRAGRIVGGQAFYRAAGASRSFSAVSFNIGLTLENSVRVSWAKLVSGPRELRGNSDFISVNVTRFPNSLHRTAADTTKK